MISVEESKWDLVIWRHFRIEVPSSWEMPAKNGTRRWRAFGMDLAVPEGLELHDCRQQAARGVNEYCFMRLGMVPVWLDRPVRTWLTTQVPPGVQIDEKKARTVDGDEVAQVTGRAKRWCRGLRLRRPVYEASAGVDRSDGRLYFVSRQEATSDGDLELPRCVEPRLVAAGTGAGASPNSSSTGKHSSTAHASPSTDLAIEGHARGAMVVTPENEEA